MYALELATYSRAIKRKLRDVNSKLWRSKYRVSMLKMSQPSLKARNPELLKRKDVIQFNLIYCVHIQLVHLVVNQHCGISCVIWVEH